MKKTKLKSNDGFTIIELMIATAVLSMVLVLVTVLMINIGNLYYKGISQSQVQDDVRSISDDITQQLKTLGTSEQLASGSASVSGLSEQSYCIGTVRYSFVLGRMVGTGTDIDGTHQVPHALWRDTNTSGGCTPLDLTQSDPTAAANVTQPGSSAPGSGTDMISGNYRLTALSITPFNPITNTSPFTVSIGVAYGNIDLLNGAVGLGVSCKGGTGDKFCSTANLTTTVQQRL